MTDTDRIADLEREVAELSEYIRQLQRTNTALGEIMRGVPPMPASLNTGTFGRDCPTCGVRWLIGTWPNNSPAPSHSDMTCPICGARTTIGLWHLCLPTFTHVGVTS